MNIILDDANLEVATAGSGDAVVLVHGFPFAHGIWNSQIERLAKDHFVIAPDLRGLGKSTGGGGPHLMETLAGDLAGVLDHLGVERANIVGHSLGGYVALAFFRMFSERVVRLGLVCSRLEADSPDAAKSRLELANQAERLGMQPVIEAYIGRLFAPQTSRAVVESTVNQIMQMDAAGAAAVLRGMAQRAPSDDLIEELSIPVLIVTGGEDTISPAGIWSKVMPRVPQARLEVCKRSAHVPMLEEPERLTELLQTFFTS